MSNYQYDIFVSYALSDDQPLTGTGPGWVTTLLDGLRSRLGLRFGNNYSLFCEATPDDETVNNAQRLEILKNSATLLVILSKHYLASTRCQTELTTFLALEGQPSPRVLVVEPEKMERVYEYRELWFCPFWIADATGHSHTLATLPGEIEGQNYNQKLDDITLHITNIRKLLNTIPASSPGTNAGIHIGNVGENVTLQAGGDMVAGDQIINVENQVIIQQVGPRATVFLAEVSDDLLEQRNEIQRYLIPMNIEIVPNMMYFFGEANASELLRQAIETDLRKSALFIQLLSQVNPQRPPGMSTPLLQHAYAQNITDLPLLQWRSPQLDLTNITDPALMTFLDATTVMASSLEDFKQYIIRQLEQIEEKKRREEHKRLKQTAVQQSLSHESSDFSDDLVFIDISAQHEQLGEAIAELLDEQGIGYTMPLLEDMSPAEKRQDLEDNLRDCDAVVLLYDDNSVKWIREQLRYCRRLQTQRDKPLKTIAVFNQNPSQKPSLGMKLPNMQILACNTLTEDTCLSQFIQSLQK